MRLASQSRRSADGSDTKACLAQSKKIAFYIRIFGTFFKLWSNGPRFNSFLVSLDEFKS